MTMSERGILYHGVIEHVLCVRDREVPLATHVNVQRDCAVCVPVYHLSFSLAKVFLFRLLLLSLFPIEYCFLYGKNQSRAGNKLPTFLSDGSLVSTPEG